MVHKPFVYGGVLSISIFNKKTTILIPDLVLFSILDEMNGPVASLENNCSREQLFANGSSYLDTALFCFHDFLVARIFSGICLIKSTDFLTNLVPLVALPDEMNMHIKNTD